MSLQENAQTDGDSSVLAGLSPELDLYSLFSSTSYASDELLLQPPTPSSAERFLLPYTEFAKVHVNGPGSDLQMARDSPFSPRQAATRATKTQHNDTPNIKARRKRRGRPRKEGGDPTEPPEEVCITSCSPSLTFLGSPNSSVKRRRKQIRLAQRAYRQREKTVLSKYESRIAELEMSICTIDKRICSLGKALTKSGVLAPYTDLQAQVLETLAACKALAEETGASSEGEHPTPATQNEVSPIFLGGDHGTQAPSSVLQLQESLHPRQSLSPRATISLLGTPEPLGAGSPLLFESPVNASAVSTVDLPFFIRQVRLACAYHAFISLRNSSVGLEDLRRKFRFLLSMMSRENLTSYFEACVLSKLHPERMLEFEELPFFRVGGAGCHFINSSQGPYETHFPIREDPLRDFSSSVQREMDGKWYDIRDLEGFIREKKVYLLTSPPLEMAHDSTNLTVVNASTFIRSKILSYTI